VGATGPGSQSVTAPGASAPTWRADIGGYTTKAHADHQGYLQITYSQVTVPSGRTLTNTWSLTASSMARSDLAAFGQAEHRIDLTDWMHRTFIIFTKPLVWILDQIVKLVPNYAIAVIILTFLVKALMFKLTWKQHASMAAMAKVAPELKYLQEQYKNDKTKLAQKQMELWKKHGVNPLGGCLPLLVQMPIFIGLFNAFQYNADMRGEHFLWISDLTLPDQIWGTPLAFLGGWVLSLNPLPIIYIAVTIWMSLSSPLPTGGDPQQEQIAKSMRWMPVLFGLIFYNMPAGLVLYFTVNALLSTIEVKFIRARLAAKG
jgi:YidC/Oxa1 family membrane protein insertase